MLDPEKVLRLVNAIAPESINEIVTINFLAYRELKDYVTEAVHSAIAKRKGGKPEETRRKTALAYLKRNEGPGVAWYYLNTWIENGYQIFTDGRSLYRFAEGHHIDGLPQMTPDEEHTVPATGKYFDRAADTTSETRINQKDLQLAIAMWKSEGKPGGSLPYPVGAAFYNAEALLETLKILGVEEAAVRLREPDVHINTKYAEGDARRIHRNYYPGHIVLEGREAVIMPVVPPKGESNDAE